MIRRREARPTSSSPLVRLGIQLAVALALVGAAAVSSRQVEPAAELAADGARGRIGSAEIGSADLPDLPDRLADTGLYADFDARELAPGVLPFLPQYPLWTDGATKRRWIRLPEGASIDASDAADWRFPPGTKLWKEFALGRAVETRYIELGSDGRWRFASYVWAEDGSDARLAPERGLRSIAESSPGVPYDAPGRADCLVCHGSGAAGAPSPVLGFTALQLSPDRDPLAPHAERGDSAQIDLRSLVERGLVRGLPREHLDSPPRIAASSPVERAALGYLHANCGMCHGRGGSLSALGLDLDIGPDGRSDALATALGQPSRATWNDGAALRIAAGDPAASVVVRRMSTRDPMAQMPPLGTHAVDARALELIKAWIRTELAPKRDAAVRDSERLR